MLGERAADGAGIECHCADGSVRLSVNGEDGHVDLSGVGVWSPHLRYGDPAQSAEAAAELEELGFTALWIPDVGGPVLDSGPSAGVDHAHGHRNRHPEPLDA
jgi:hypothetical protein